MFWVLFLIFLALAFDYLNGFHDAANSVSTIISTRVLSPRVAIWWATAFNFLACFIFHMGVAKTIGGFCAETGASLSLFLSSWFGLPVSTTHIITGGIVGAGMFKRFSAVHWGVARRIVWAWVITMPAAGAIAALSYFLKTL